MFIKVVQYGFKYWLVIFISMVGGISAGFLALIIIISIWELIWKGIALWRTGRNNQLKWFVALLILNTAGILPILYLLFFQKK